MSSLQATRIHHRTFTVASISCAVRRLLPEPVVRVRSALTKSGACLRRITGRSTHWGTRASLPKADIWTAREHGRLAQGWLPLPAAAAGPHWGSEVNSDQQQPAHPPQPRHSPQVQYQHQPYGYPQPGWPGPPPPKNSRFGWILGGVGLSVALLCILVFAGCSALAQEINGGGGSQEEKASAMRARADNVPEHDWVEVFRLDPKVDPGCLSIDTSCLRLNARWSVTHKVSLESAASRFGMTSGKGGPALERYVGCVRTATAGVSRESLCIDASPEGPDSYEVTIQMERD